MIVYSSERIGTKGISSFELLSIYGEASSTGT